MRESTNQLWVTGRLPGGAPGLIALTLVLLLAVHLGHGQPFTWDDQGQYLSHARALLEGRPYLDVGFISTPYNKYIGPLAEPPGLPVLIAPFLAVSGDNLLPVRLMVLGVAAILVTLTWRYASRTSTTGVALAACLILIAVFSEQHLIDAAMSDLPFCAAVWGVILAADDDAPLTPVRLAAMALLGAIAFTLRTAAVALIPSLLLFALFRRRREWIGLSIVAVSWAVAAKMSLIDIPAATVLGTQVVRDGFAFIDKLDVNIRTMGRGIFTAMTYPLNVNLLDDAWHVAGTLLSGVGAWLLLKEAPRRFAHFFAFGYVAMLLVSPAADARYWMPLIPLQLVALARGVGHVLGGHARPAYRVAAGVAITAIFGSALVRGAREPAVPLFERPEVLQVVDAIKATPAQDSVRVSFFSPRLFTWNTRIPAMGHFVASPDETLAEFRRLGITHLVVGSLGESAALDSSLRAAIAARPGAFLHRGDFGGLSLYQIAE